MTLAEQISDRSDICRHFYSFIYDFVEKNVEESLRLLRLFKEGNVHMPYWIVYYFDKDEPVILFARGLSSSQSQNNYHLNDDEILTAQDFIEITRLPSPPNYITLAHENYEVSYFIDNESHAFFSLMISLEVLLKPKERQNFSKKISDKVGILLGNSDPEIQIIQNEMARLYNKRHELVHEGIPIFHYAGEMVVPL